MALSGMIRKASPSVVPLALRAIGSSATLNLTISPSRQQDVPLRSFSSVAAERYSVNNDIYKILKQQIKSAKFNLKNCQVNIPPDSFPFTVDDSGYGYSNQRELVLTRKMVDDEFVTVKIKMSDVNIKEDDTKDDTSASDDDDESDESTNDINEEEIKADGAIPMTVRIAKPDGNNYLDFNITVSTEDIIIQCFSITTEDHGSYDGPEFGKLDYKFQQALYKYLEVRGIKSDIESFVIKIMAKEKRKHDLKALKCFKNAIKILLI